MFGSSVRVSAALLAGALAIVAGMAPVGATTAPGTPKQVAALVAKAPSIAVLPADVTPPLASAGSDDPLTAYPSLIPCISGQDSEPACVFGDTHGTRTMVLFGDSHALMWFPALDAIAKAARWRLVALMNYGCPVADVTVWNVVSGGPDTGCPVFRQHMIKRIDRLDPALVIASETVYYLDAQDHPITDAEWTMALEKSLEALHARSKVLIGESYLVPEPLACLAANPNSIQTCSRSDATAAFTSQLGADKAAAKAAKVAYVNELPWECSKTCTVVIGKMIAYNSSGHLSTTYVRYLTDVMRLALKPSMR
jgi:SGNH domain (fused to AT3 domains)